MQPLHYPARTVLVLLLILGVGCSQTDPAAETPVAETVEIDTSETDVSESIGSEVAEATDLNETDSEAEATQAGAETYQKALEMGMSAATAAQDAFSIDDWDLVINRWQAAINFLKAVPESSEHYATAQQKITDYENNAAVARQHKEALNQDTTVALANPATAPSSVSQSPQPTSGSPTPSAPANSSISHLCQGALPAGNTVVLSNFQFIRDEFESENEDYLVGCITNRGSQPARISALTYTTEGDGMGFGITSLDMQQDTLAPGQSLPWRSGFTFDDGDRKIHLDTLTVRWEGGDSEDIALATTINH